MQSNSEKNKIIFKRLLQSITQIDWEKIKIEIKNVQEDFKNHKSGVLLWAEEAYPNYMLLISALFGSAFDSLTSSFLPGMKEVVDEYFNFHDEVKAKNSKLYQEEIEESNKLFFNKTIQPMDILVAKDAYIKNFNRKFSEGLRIYSTQVQDYSEKVRPILTSFGKQIKEKSNLLAREGELDLELKEINLDRDDITSVDDAFGQLEEQLKTYPKKFQNIIKIGKETYEKLLEIQKETLSYVPELNKEFRNLTEDFMEIYSADDPSWVYQRLSLIKDIDSFHIQFTKFITRLFHILSYDNRDYLKKIVINPKKHYYDTRDKLKKILKREINQRFPKLSDYLLSIFKYNKYRKIEAHQVPIIRISDGIAYIFDSGTNKEVKMNLEEIQTMINTYSYFIKALNLIKNYEA